MISIAPTGTISMLMGNVSSGIEPIFALEYERTIKNQDGTERKEIHRNYAWDLYCKLNPEADVKNPPAYFKTALRITPEAHIKVLAFAAEYVDQAISKTVNVPTDMTFDEFKGIYLSAHENGIKGCTTYRPNNIRKGILQEIGETPKTGVLNAKRHIVNWKNQSKVYLSVSETEEGKPLEVFAKLPKVAGIEGGVYNDIQYLTYSSDWELICRLISKRFTDGMTVQDLLDDCEKSSYTMYSLPAIIQRVFTTYLTQEQKAELITQGIECPKCGSTNTMKEQNCLKCLDCGDSKCG
jgi:ribonucleoside-diphosphate reductase alpha chain